MKKKKILFLSPLPPPHYGSAMSSEMCLEILRNSKEFEVRNIQLNYSKEMGDIGKANLDKVKGIFKVRREIKKQLKEFKPNTIYFVPATTSFGLIRDSYFAKLVHKYWKGKVIFHIRSRILDKDWSNIIKKRRITSMLKNQKAIILGEELRRDLRNLIPKKDIFILSNAIKNEISEKEFKKIMAQRRKRNPFNILFLSNMTPSKGWPKLLEACRILNEKNINFQCNFVGGWISKNDEKYFNNFVKQNRLQKKVFYLGKRTGNEKLRVLKENDVLIFPTEYPLETFGRVIVEGMMAGLPVIANGIATIPSIIENRKTGFVLKKNSPIEIAEEIIKLEDKDLRLKMSQLGRKRFSREFELKKYKKEFKKIIFSNI